MNPIVQREYVVAVTVEGDLALVRVAGLIDERFEGLGDLSGVRSLILDVTGMTRMTSFGVRQWLRAIEGLRSITETYLFGCPTFFVDQLNMVMNFGGGAKVVTVVAPYVCNGCGHESSELVDVLGDRAALLKSEPPAKQCGRCGERLELDETPQSYFSFATRYAASSLSPGVVDMLVRAGLYRAVESTNEKPPRIIKLVHNTVTYFRIIGTIGSMFRARPLLVGAEGEVVIDLAEVDRCEPTGLQEWRRLLRSLSSQVAAITLVDTSEEFLTRAADAISPIRNLALWSMLVRYRCAECGKTSQESVTLPARPAPRVCANCGGETRGELETGQRFGRIPTPVASAKLIQQREEVLSRAVTDAAVARAGSNATAVLVQDDTILGKYKIVRRLPEGGMAEVFLAKQVGLGGFEKPVALKRIQRQLLESRHLAIDMFLNEAKIVGRLLHPNIVQVLDVGELNGALYLAMEFVNGKDLRQIVKRLRGSQGTMPLGVICFVIREIAVALNHAFWSADMAGNQLSVVHRDVSPHNVIISWDGSVKLLDFGVAMSSVTETSAAMIVGKWLYMSPEATSNAPLDHRSDLFSLGVVAYLLCSGNMPFGGADPTAIVRAIRAGGFRPLKQAAPDLPVALTSLVDRMLATDPNMRPETGADVAAVLDEISRSYGFDTSKDSVSQFLVALFRDTDTPHAPISLVSEFPDSLGSASTAFDDHIPDSGSASHSLHGDLPDERSASLPHGTPPAPPIFMAPPVESLRRARRIPIILTAIVVTIVVVLLIVYAY